MVSLRDVAMFEENNGDLTPEAASIRLRAQAILEQECTSRLPLALPHVCSRNEALLGAGLQLRAVHAQIRSRPRGNF